MSSVLISGKYFSAHFINGLILSHLISVLYPQNSAVPAILNLSFPNLDVTANESLEPKLLAGDLRKKGIRTNLADNTKVALFEMQGERGQEYWLGLSDFYVITRYNRSSMYALAVFQLSQAIKQERIDLLNSLN